MSALDQVTVIARQDAFRFLSASYCEPTPIFREERLFESISGVAEFLGPEAKASADRLSKAFDGTTDQDLLVDYTRLFVGPARPLAPPYESVWVSPSENLSQEPTLAVLELYQQGGFCIDDGINDLPDHIAVELEFVYRMLFESNHAEQQGDHEKAAITRALHDQFLAQHLNRWVDPFLQTVADHASTSFYQELSVFSRHVLT